ncbi:MAG: ligase-associated DNA damage response DEXH box helicase [Pseudomonadota bacterium]
MSSTASRPLPAEFQTWFAQRGWDIHDHQHEILDAATHAASLLIAPTGGGKTLAGFLPSLVDLFHDPSEGLHTLYISPLKALAADIKRNLRAPVEEIGIPIRIEDRTGDTSQTQRKRQRAAPPHILLTTPESLAVLLSYGDAPHIFAGLKRVIIDEAHALAESKRGDQLTLCLARLQQMHSGLKRIALSATVENPAALAQYFGPAPDPCQIIHAAKGPTPQIEMLRSTIPPPWAGAGAAHSVTDVYKRIKQAKTSLIFINTRAQAEIYFHALWKENIDNLPIGLHHGSLSKDARAKVEAAMAQGSLRAIVCTGSLDLGIDWGDVDLVFQIGAPKNIKRLVQRIGRSNHRYNEPSQAIIVPANRFEVIECLAALEAATENDLDGEPRPDAPLDVLCQHILIYACAAPIDADHLYQEVKGAGPFRTLPREDFDACLDYAATGGYAFRKYDRWQRLIERSGLWHLRDPRTARQIRMNIGTIIDTDTLKVRYKMRGGAPLGEVEENFAAGLTPGDTFLIGGRIVRYEGLREMVVEVTNAASKKPKIAVFDGTKFAASTLLSQRVISILENFENSPLPADIKDWLSLQNTISALPNLNQLLVESFMRGEMHYTCIYGFAGRNAHQTLGLLLTKRMEDLGLGAIGFVTTDYALLIWSVKPIENPADVLDISALRETFAAWLGGNAVMKRSFKAIASIAGLIDKAVMGKRKTGKQVTFSSDILYDTLRKYEPDHLLMRITHDQALSGLVDFGRIEEFLERTKGRIHHTHAPHITPLAAPLLLEVGKIPIEGKGREALLIIRAEELMAESGLDQLR